MELIDISWPLTIDMTGYKNHNAFMVHTRKTFDRDHVRESSFNINAHAGTHIDAPAHFIEQGCFVDAVPLEKLIALGVVIDFSGVSGGITEAMLHAHEDKLLTDSFVLLKTDNSLLSPNASFNHDFVYLHDSGAAYLIHKKIRGIGIDYLGIERNQPDHTTHTLLMNAGIIIVEGLRLGHVQAGAYTFTCLPLALIGVEAAPARAILIR